MALMPSTRRRSQESQKLVSQEEASVLVLWVIEWELVTLRELPVQPMGPRSSKRHRVLDQQMERMGVLKRLTLAPP